MSAPTPDWTCTSDELADLGGAPAAIPTSDGVLRIAGPGAAECIQGILTNDIERLVPGAMIHGAVLTAKGMIITPLWCLRDTDGFVLIVPKAGVAPLSAQLARSFPPRLARVTDLSDQWSPWWLIGGGPAPGTGQLGLPDGPAPFDQIWLQPATPPGPASEAPDRETLAPWYADVLSLLQGWPVLGREIDERTLPQEVRFDELASVKYDKGCYVGQETVARLHFRGHANRTLRAIIGSGAAPADRTVTSSDNKDVGRISSLGVIGETWLGACKLRREVADGDTVTVSGQSARVAAFPVSPLELRSQRTDAPITG